MVETITETAQSQFLLDSFLLGLRAENASKRTTVLLRSGGNENEVDATIRVQDEKFWRASISVFG